MSDRINEFDQLFRDRLRDHAATPPDSVWSNIQAERTFGHIVANKISSTWRIIGTILLLAIAGGTSALLLSHEEDSQNFEELAKVTLEDDNTSNETQDFVSNKTTNEYDHLNQKNAYTLISSDLNNSIEETDQFTTVQSDLLASRSDFGFGKPHFDDNKLGALVDEMPGWGTAKPSSYVRYYNLTELDKKEFEGNKLVKSPMIPRGNWDYVIETIPNKGFKDKASLHFYLGPQFINKILTPKYNMETAFLEKRQKTENTRLAYTFGVNLQYELKNNKFIESGIQFTQIYEEVRIDGDMRFSNQYDFLEIPFLIGYQDRESKWGWFVKGGFGVQIYNNYKGYILKNVEDRIVSSTPAVEATEGGNGQYRLSGSNVVNNIVKNDHNLSKRQDRNEVYDLGSSENPYRTSGIINVHMAAGFTYFHSINTSFTLSPYYRQSVNSLTRESADFNERISYMGVMIGTNVKF